MKRDMELVRDILKTVEDSEGPVGAEEFVGAGWSMDTVYYHIRLMDAHGLIDAV